MNSRPPNLTCAHCAKPFHRFPSQTALVKHPCCTRKCGYAFAKTTAEARFWDAVEKTEGCWNFTKGDAAPFGYRRFYTGRRPKERAVAHRFSWELHYSPIPDGLLVLHRCDNPQCVRPDHLFLGTHQDNSEDMISKGRHYHGERHHRRQHPERVQGEDNPRAILTAAQVEAIRTRFVAGGVTILGLSKEYGVCRAVLRSALVGDTWDHVPFPGVTKAELEALITARTRKFSLADARECRRLRAEGWTYIALAERFGVTPPACRQIVKGRFVKEKA